MENDITYKSKQIFNYLFDKAQAEGEVLTPMKAVKLVYFAHAWTLGFTDKPLLNEPVQAWKYGAVIPSLYDSLKVYGANPIRHAILKDQKNYIIPLFIDDYNSIPKNQKIEYGDLEQTELDIIDSVWSAYKGMTAVQMSNIIHQPGTPWTQVWNGSFNTVIPNSIIRDHYKEKIQNASNNTKQ